MRWLLNLDVKNPGVIALTVILCSGQWAARALVKLIIPLLLT